MEIDYKKEYEAMVQRARELHETGNELTKRQMEIVCQELRESEDERHRKWILEYLYDGLQKSDEQFKDQFKSAISWLEKQKESLHIEKTCKDNADSFTDACKDVIVAIEKYLDWLTGYPDYAPKGKYSLRDMLHCLYVLEKQKEQKPNIEICPHSIKSKSYKERGYPIEDCDYGLEIALQILKKTLGKVEGYQTDDGLREHQTAMKAVKDAMKEQKPPIAGNDFGWIDELKHDLKHPEELDQKVDDVLKQRKGIRALEWSEEDEKELDCIINILDRLGFEEFCKSSRDQDIEEERFYYKEIQFLKRLKSLRPQHRKEQDVEKYPEDNSFEDEWKNYYNNSLVSRRPMNKREVAKHFYWFAKKNAWKPSEEQMKELNRARRFIPYNCYILESLYEQLKKLM